MEGGGAAWGTENRDRTGEPLGSAALHAAPRSAAASALSWHHSELQAALQSESGVRTSGPARGRATWAGVQAEAFPSRHPCLWPSFLLLLNKNWKLPWTDACFWGRFLKYQQHSATLKWKLCHFVRNNREITVKTRQCYKMLLDAFSHKPVHSLLFVQREIMYQKSFFFKHILTFWPTPCIKPGEGNGNPLQYFCLENPMDGGAWWARVHGVTKSRTRLSDFTHSLIHT